jgi:hypothetical protein
MSDITKKPEKLSSALYLISGFFNDLEPLKWKLRSLASELVALSIPLKDNFLSDRERRVVEINNIISEISSLLGVAKNAGLISDMNYNLINKEFSTYSVSLNSAGEDVIKTKGPMLSSEYFALGNNASENENNYLPERTQTEDKNLDKGQKDIIENQQQTDPVLNTENRAPIAEIEKETPRISTFNEGIMASSSNRGGESSSAAKPLKEFGAVSVKKNSRQSTIISLLKRKKEIMIKDVSPLISGCSEKTIQRELSSMVEAGILKRLGEKRWSRYTLA